MKKLIVTLCAVAAVQTMQAADYDYLTIVETDGTRTSLTAIGLTISFSDGNLVATNTQTSEQKTVSLGSLASLNFSTSNETTTGISRVEADSFGTSEADAIYDLQGRQIPAGSSLTRGVYIIKKGGLTRKIQIR